MKIAGVYAHQIYDSRGNPTIACEMVLDDGSYVTSMVPAGASVGTHEALDLRDGGNKFGGKGVSLAIQNIQTKIAPRLVGQEVGAFELDAVLDDLDSSERRTTLGANSLLAVSMALYRAHANAAGLELYELIAQMCQNEQLRFPAPMINMINGGAHADNNLSVQEYLIIPHGASSFAQAMEMAAEISRNLHLVLRAARKSVCVGDEGGFAPTFRDSAEPLEMLREAVAQAGYSDAQVAFGLDVAASQLFDTKNNTYTLDGKKFTREELIDWYASLVEQYPIISIEDPLDQDDWDGWVLMRQRLGKRVYLVGDDLLVSRAERIAYAIECQAISGAIIKPNQIGIMTQALESLLLCKQNEIVTIVSHRSGETCDTFIADLALGAGANYIKCGGCARSERLAKYNRLLQIEFIRTVLLD